MIRLIHRIIAFFLDIRFIPVILAYYIFVSTKRGQTLKADRKKWAEVIPARPDNFKTFLYLLSLPEFRTVVYYRIGFLSILFSWIAPGQNSLYLRCRNIGPGLVIQHGHSTRLGAHSVGENLQIRHNVTVGTNRSKSGNLPTIGNNVKICTGAIVLGEITIGDGATIGAGAVVVKDVPAGAVVVGNPAHEIRQKRD